MVKKGIIIAGGKGTRLDPVTRVTSKQLLLIYDKPMIFYPLAVLMRGGIREILIICAPNNLPSYQTLLGDGSHLGICIEYIVQPEAKGIPEALILGEQWINHSPVCLILGDNLFYGNLDPIRNALSHPNGAHIFAIPTREPERFGIVELDSDGKVLSIEEKPNNPKSDLAIPGIYIYDETASQRAAKLTPSARGELEISDLNAYYLRGNQLTTTRLGRGFLWLDTGTPDSMLEAANFIATVQRQSHYQIACLEEVAYRCGYISAEQLEYLANQSPLASQREYLKDVLTKFQ